MEGFEDTSQTLAIKSSTHAKEVTTEPVEVIKRHYWSGAKIYRTEDGRFLEIKLGEMVPEKFYRYDIAKHALYRIKRDEMAVPAAEQRSARTRYVIRSGRKFLGRFCYGDALPVELYGEPGFDDFEYTSIALIKMRRKVASENRTR